MSDVLVLPDFFEGVVIHSPREPVEAQLPFAFEGFVFVFDVNTIFVNVKNGLGKPIQGLQVETPYLGSTMIGTTDSLGYVRILCDATGTITFRKEKTFRTKAYVRASEGSIVNYVFNVPILE